jgi:adenine-specific DNA-methyltransferase
MRKEITSNNVWFGKDGNGVPRPKRFLSAAEPGLTPETLWRASEVGTSDSAKKHLLQIFPDHKVFGTPKPEELVHRLLKISTDPGDLVLDAYLGSGTTAAVAHKMGRRFVEIELGQHAITHCAEWLRQVVDDESGGVSTALEWTGGCAGKLKSTSMPSPSRL